jgi:acetyl-CoA acetyltransferase
VPEDYDGVVIAGYGETPVVKQTERSTLSFLAEAIQLALGRAGLAGDDVDGMVIGSFTLAPEHPIHAVERLGFELRWFEAAEPGGASGITSILHAARAIQAGDAAVVVCAAADVLTTGVLRELNSRFPTAMNDPNAAFAEIQRRHMDLYGTTAEQLGAISVLSRFHGSLNPQALFQREIALADYLGSRVIVDPIRLLDCVHPGAGGAAVVLRAGDGGVRIAAGAERHGATQTLEFGWATMGAEVERLDAVQLYDDYPIMVLIQLEDLGFCGKGDGGPFVERTNLRFDGELPLNTGGGMLSCGQAGAAGGYVAPIEAIRQLRGEGGRRQVKDARSILVSGLGMIGSRVPLSTSMAVFAR